MGAGLLSAQLLAFDWNSSGDVDGVAYLTRVTGNTFFSSALNKQGGGGNGYVDLGEELTKLKVQLLENDRDFDGGQIGISYL